MFPRPLLFLTLLLSPTLLPTWADARPHARWTFDVRPAARLPQPRRLDGLIDAATRILLAERLARRPLVVVLPCCERPPVYEPWRFH